MCTILTNMHAACYIVKPGVNQHDAIISDEGKDKISGLMFPKKEFMYFSFNSQLNTYIRASCSTLAVHQLMYSIGIQSAKRHSTEVISKSRNMHLVAS